MDSPTSGCNDFDNRRDPRMSLQPGSIILSPTWSFCKNDEALIFEPESRSDMSNDFTSFPSFDNSDSENNPVHNEIRINTKQNISDSSLTKADLRRIRNEFIKRITVPSPDPGYIRCYLCDQEIWGPNGEFVFIQIFISFWSIFHILTFIKFEGRYHIDKCNILLEKRRLSRELGKPLSRILGVSVDESILKPLEPTPKEAKVKGFVKSNSVSVDDPTHSPSAEERQTGVSVGRSGYVRCLICNAEVFAPNSKHHAQICHSVIH